MAATRTVDAETQRLARYDLDALNRVAGDGVLSTSMPITRMFGVAQQLFTQARNYEMSANLPYAYVYYRRLVLDVGQARYVEWVGWCKRVAASSTDKCEMYAQRIKKAREAVSAAASAASSGPRAGEASGAEPVTPMRTPEEVAEAEYASALAILSGGGGGRRPAESGRGRGAPLSLGGSDVSHDELTAAVRALGLGLGLGGGGGGGGGGGAGGGGSGGSAVGLSVGGGSAGAKGMSARDMLSATELELWGYELAGPRDGVVGWTPRFEGGRGASPWLKCGGVVRGLPGAPARGKQDGPLRRVHFPLGIVDRFLRFAAPNNAIGERGVESCGVLCGRVVEDVDPAAGHGDGGGGSLVISHVVIPAQKAGPDWVEMTREQDLFQYCIDNNLIQIGWIHTHPTQECFMSSFDVRTHLGFQTMLPEAVAIVVAPRDPAMLYGMFRLVEPEGIELVRARPDARPVEVAPGIILYETTPQAKVHSHSHGASASAAAAAAAARGTSIATAPAHVPTHADDFHFVDLSRGEIGPPR